MGPHITDGGWGFTYLVTTQDRLWYDDGLRMGWRLPPPAALVWRAWGLRHLRWVIRSIWVWVWDRRFERLGLPTPGFEAWVCYAIGRGWV